MRPLAGADRAAPGCSQTHRGLAARRSRAIAGPLGPDGRRSLSRRACAGGRASASEERVATKAESAVKTLAAIACVMALLLAPSTGRSATPDLPNLVALPPFDVQIGPADQLASASDSALRFSFATANR